MAELQGTNAIEYYLKGVAIRQQKEARMLQWANQQEQNKLRQQQLDQIQARFETSFEDQKRMHDAQINQINSKIEVDKAQAIMDIGKAFHDKLIEVDPNNPLGGMRLTKLGEASAEAIKNKYNEYIAMTAPVVDRATQTARGNAAVQMTLQQNLHDMAMAKQDDQQAY